MRKVNRSSLLYMQKIKLAFGNRWTSKNWQNINGRLQRRDAICSFVWKVESITYILCSISETVFTNIAYHICHGRMCTLLYFCVPYSSRFSTVTHSLIILCLIKIRKVTSMYINKSVAELSSRQSLTDQLEVNCTELIKEFCISLTCILDYTRSLLTKLFQQSCCKRELSRSKRRNNDKVSWKIALYRTEVV